MDDAAFTDALGRALRSLRASDRYESEVRSALSGTDPEIVERVVAHLREKRMLDDRRTTESAIARNVGRRAVGDGLLRERLARRGADVETVATQLTHSEDEPTRIAAILAAKYRPTDDRRKAGRFLFSRGFSEEAIESALDHYFVEVAE